MVSVNYEIEGNVEQKTVYYTGADAIADGMLLAYDRDTATGVRGDTQAVTAFGSGRYRKVEKLTLANIADFAGVVKEGGGCAARTDGGLSQVTIIVPKDGIAVNVYCYLNTTINVTILHPVAGQYYAGMGPALSPWAFKAVQTHATAGTTAALVECVFIRATAAEAPINPCQVDTVQQHALGSRYVDPVDGRVYRYCLAGTGGVVPGFGAAFGAVTHHAYEAIHAAASIGDTTVLIDQASVTVDEFAGGYIILGHNANATCQVRRVISNTVSADSTNHVTVTLDRPLTANLTTGEGYEIIANLYANMVQGGEPAGTLEKQSFAGVPAAVIAAASYGWVQTWGPCFCTPGGGTTPGDSANDRMVYFVGDGSVNGGAHLTYAGKAYQPAGFIITEYSAAGDPPLVMLQIAP
jgi:hypothetical protein